MPINNIVLIGAGNLASQLGRVLHEKGINILQVLSRLKESAELLAGKIDSTPIINSDQLMDDADLYVLAVPDDEIPGIVDAVNFHDRLIVHTSGSVDMKVLQNASSQYGVFYPLQTFSKAKNIDFSDIPICVESSGEDTCNELFDLGRLISNDVRRINSSQRRSVHIAAIFASNFTNYMYKLADEILEKENISFDILQPLIRETASKVKTNSPGDAQTGPASRGDMKIIEKHIQDLKNDPVKLVVYKIISKVISDGHW